MPSSEPVRLAVDLGASSGRVVAGTFDGQQLSIREIHRFDNGPTPVAGHLYWDVLHLWDSIQEGLRATVAEVGSDGVLSVGVDTWGVDFGLVGRGDELLGNPYHYRDHRTAGMMERTFQTVSREEIFAETGLQFMELSTLYQLVAMKENQSPLLEVAESFLMMPDLFHWLLTGEKVNEQTNATTTQLFNPNTQNWSHQLADRLGLPTRILGTVVPPGTRLGRVKHDVAAATGLKQAEVLLPGTHDTASAVLSVPASGAPSAQPDWCYISSGTWSLMGVEIPMPVITDRCRELNFTNEGGVGGTTRLLKNIAGLWLVQECRRIWGQQGRRYDWEQLVQLAQNTQPLVSFVDPDAECFVAPDDMAQAVSGFCSQSSQPVPETDGQIMRCVLESLAMRYRTVLLWLEELTGGRIETLHIVGGGAQNRLLCQMAADATGRRVVTGPVEATAIGNLMMQAVAAGDIDSIDDAREVVRRSFSVDEYVPLDTAPWDAAFDRFCRLHNG